MSGKISGAISYLFHPLLMPFYGFILLFSTNSILLNVPFNAQLMLAMMVLISTAILPLLIIFFVKRKGLIATWQMNNKEERILPYIIIAVSYYLTYQMLAKLQLPVYYYYYILGAALLVVLSLLINFFWKISAHLVGIGGLTGTFIAIQINFGAGLHFWVASLIIVSGLVAYARFKSGGHNYAQIYTGYLLGVLIMSVLLTLLL